MISRADLGLGQGAWKIRKIVAFFVFDQIFAVTNVEIKSGHVGT